MKKKRDYPLTKPQWDFAESERELSKEEDKKLKEFDWENYPSIKFFELMVRSAKAYTKEIPNEKNPKKSIIVTDKAWKMSAKYRLMIVEEELAEYFFEAVESVAAEMQRHFIASPLTYLIEKMREDKKDDGDIPF